jgi:hypothetical protein
MAVLSAIVGFAHLFVGFDNAALVRLMRVLLDRPYTSRQATYDLRRLRRKELITRIPGTSSRLWAGASQCSSQKLTAASLRQGSRGSTRAYRQRSRGAARSPWPGGISTVL